MKLFGYWIHVRPPGIHNKHFYQDACQGVFFGYVPQTYKPFVWYDKNSERIEIAPHAKFDKGFNDLSINNLPPNCQHIFD